MHILCFSRPQQRRKFFLPERLCWYSGIETAQTVPETSSSPEQAKDAPGDHLEDPSKALDLANKNLTEANAEVTKETAALVSDYRRDRSLLESMKAEGLPPQDAWVIQKELRTLQTELQSRGVTLAQLGIPDIDGSAQQNSLEAGASLQSQIVIEYSPGQQRNGNEVHYAYGYFPGIVDQDHEFLDVMVNNPLSSSASCVYVIKQIRQTLPPKQGGDGTPTEIYDPENKCMVGFSSEEAARAAYLQEYPEGWQAGPIEAIPVAEFPSRFLQKA